MQDKSYSKSKNNDSSAKTNGVSSSTATLNEFAKQLDTNHQSISLDGLNIQLGRENNSQQQEKQNTRKEQGQDQKAGGIGSDGHEIFKLARNALSYDEFTALLWNVKA